MDQAHITERYPDIAAAMDWWDSKAWKYEDADGYDRQRDDWLQYRAEHASSISFTDWLSMEQAS